MGPLKNKADELRDEMQDAISANPRTDYEPPDTQEQSAPEEGPAQDEQG